MSKGWFSTGRLGLHAYMAQGVSWEQTRIEKTAGDLPTMFEQVVKTFEGAAPKIAKLLDERVKEAEKAPEGVRAVEERWRREEEERRRNEEEAARVKRIQENIASWRMALDIRAYVTEIHARVNDAELKITEGGQPHVELTWALAYADRIDPMTSWRKDIEKVNAGTSGKLCPATGRSTATKMPLLRSTPPQTFMSRPLRGVVAQSSRSSKAWPTQGRRFHDCGGSFRLRSASAAIQSRWFRPLDVAVATHAWRSGW